ncbi:MAG: HlyC/CorC family transporter [Clostridia bacterium]|nr:HlyC/CorC family transporter [Clostridia bacterium]
MDIFLMVLCILLSAFFSSAETAYSSVNKIKLKSIVDNGSRRAEGVLDIIERYDRFLTTVLIGNNLVNILLATIAAVFFVNKVSGEYGTTLSTVVVTVVVLIFGEITPKTLAKAAPEKYAMAIYPVVKGLVILFAPLGFIFSLWTKLISKISRVKEDPTITDDELITIVNEAYNEGGLDENESELIRNAIVFDDRQAEDILTPRVDIVAVSCDASHKEISEIFSETGYSRLPVYDGSLDNIIGVIHQKDFYEEILEGRKDLKYIMQKPIFVAPTMKISKLLKELQSEQTHVAVVVDEYGGTAGIVTMEDILEELVGEIWDEHDEVVEDVAELSDGEYLVQGTLTLEEFFERFEISDDESEADTLSGWVMEKLGKIPEAGESFEYGGYAFTIHEIVSRRITEVKIRRLEEDTVDEDSEE